MFIIFVFSERNSGILLDKITLVYLPINPYFTVMKNKFSYRSIYIILSLILLSGSCFVWIIKSFHTEEQIFYEEIQKIMERAITEDLMRNIDSVPSVYSIHGTDTLTMYYQLEGHTFRVDTFPRLFRVFHERQIYDFTKKFWSLDSLATRFQSYNPYPALRIILLRQTAENKVIDRFPANIHTPSAPPSIPPIQLGNIHDDILNVWVRMPFQVFWQRQTGMILSFVFLAAAIVFGILLLMRERREQRGLALLNEQTVFIHNLKTPLCTNRDLEIRTLKNKEEWSLEKIRDRLASAAKRSAQLLQEAEEFTSRTASPWQGKDHPHTNLQTLLEQVAERYRSPQSAPITVECRTEDTDVNYPPFHIIHMVDNLVSNAVRHTPESGEIRLSCFRNCHGQWNVCVENRNGQSSLVTDGQPSHGIGLTYIRKTMQQSGGKLHIRPQEHGGISCILTFPRTFKRHVNLPAYIYPCFSVLLLIAGSVWTTSHYTAARRQFLQKEQEYIYSAVYETAADLIKWIPDSVFFTNNRKEQTVTVSRYGQDTTLPMGDYTNQITLYEKAFYDLRGPHWNLDTVYSLYRRLSDNRLPVVLTRTDRSGKQLERFPSDGNPGPWPVTFSMFLGHVEHHNLEARLEFPWQTVSGNLAGWIAIALLPGIATLVFSLLLSGYDRRQQALVRFQQNRALRLAQYACSMLRQAHFAEISLAEILSNRLPDDFSVRIQENIHRYRDILQKINLLLDQIVAMHRR